MAIETVLIEYLSDKDRAIFQDVHKNDACASRTLAGWYTRKNLRVAFYTVPSWISRQKMYWVYGWSWEANTK